MSRTARTLIAVCVCLFLVAGVGCRSGKTRTRVSGTVTAAGQPVKAGRITFRPVGGGPAFTDTISAGRYGIRRRSPLPAGRYDVTIEYSTTGTGRGGYDRQGTDRVSLGGFGRDAIDFTVP